jgi:hypothetical protein
MALRTEITGGGEKRHGYKQKGTKRRQKSEEVRKQEREESRRRQRWNQQS